MVNHDKPWSIMIHYDKSWYIMRNQKVQKWFIHFSHEILAPPGCLVLAAAAPEGRIRVPQRPSCSSPARFWCGSWVKWLGNLKSYQKNDQKCMDHPNSNNKPTKHRQSSPTCDIVSSCIILYLQFASSVSNVNTPLKSTQDLLELIYWAIRKPTREQTSLCPLRPRCHHFRPGPFLSLLRFYTFSLPSFVGALREK